jgi:non-canonical poly(A) RNA polymerase PAPD5/7
MSPIDIRTNLPPWLDTHCVGRDLSLHDEITRFLLYATPYVEELQVRMALVEQIKQVVHSLWPNAKIAAFGSFDTGLFLPISDLDLVVLNLPASLAPKHAMFKLARQLRRRGLGYNLQVISQARVPIIKLTEESTHLDVDICFDQTSGIHSSAFVKAKMQEWPELKPLVVLLKYFLRLRNLHEPFSGGVGSYALVIMTLSFLQMYEAYNHGSEQSNDLGQLLFEFFYLYGVKFNYVTTGMSVRGSGSYFPKSRKGWYQRESPARLSIEDPQNPENDVGKSAFQILQVQMAFAEAYQTICSERDLQRQLGAQPGAQPRKSRRTLLQRLFGDQHGMIQERRAKVLADAVGTRKAPDGFVNGGMNGAQSEVERGVHAHNSHKHPPKPQQHYQQQPSSKKARKSTPW